jgi:hypothetical protein
MGAMDQAADKLELSIATGRRAFAAGRIALLLVVLTAGKNANAQTPAAQTPGLPDAPSAVTLPAQPASSHKKPPPCAPQRPNLSPEATASVQARNKALRPCREENPIQSVVSSPYVKPLTDEQKFRLAVHEMKDPFNLAVLTGGGGIYIASNAHNPYGPGMKGWGKIEGYSLVQDAQGVFLGTFLIPVLTHEDPRYHRMGAGGIRRRVLHAALHTYVSQHDDGRLMPNYAVLGNYVIGSELANLWVPGTPVNASSTAKRIGLGIALDPAGTMIGEFLPDIARHIHVHNGLIQQLLNTVATGNPNTPP